MLPPSGRVVVSHNTSFLREVTTRCLWLEGGRVRRDGATAEVLDAYEAEGVLVHAAAPAGPTGGEPGDGEHAHLVAGLGEEVRADRPRGWAAASRRPVDRLRPAARAGTDRPASGFRGCYPPGREGGASPMNRPWPLVLHACSALVLVAAAAGAHAEEPARTILGRTLQRAAEAGALERLVGVTAYAVDVTREPMRDLDGVSEEPRAEPDRTRALLTCEVALERKASPPRLVVELRRRDPRDVFTSQDRFVLALDGTAVAEERSARPHQPPTDRLAAAREGLSELDSVGAEGYLPSELAWLLLAPLAGEAVPASFTLHDLPFPNPDFHRLVPRVVSLSEEGGARTIEVRGLLGYERGEVRETADGRPVLASLTRSFTWSPVRWTGRERWTRLSGRARAAFEEEIEQAFRERRVPLRTLSVEGKPVAGVRVSLRDEAGDAAVAYSDEEGRAWVAHGGSGAYRLSVSARGHHAFECRGERRDIGRSLELELEEEHLRAGPTVHLLPLIEVRGRVRDPAGRALVRARVRWDGSRSLSTDRITRTDSDGRFAFAAPPGELFLVVTAPGWRPHRERVELERGAPQRPLEVALERGRTFTGRVVDPDGRPLAGARVEVTVDRAGLPSPAPPGSADPTRGGTQWTARTNAEGRFQAEGLPAEGSVDVLAYEEGFAPALRTDVPPESEPALVLRPGGGVSGVVLGPEGEPFSGDGVVRAQDLEEAVPLEDGRFSLEIPHRRRYYLTFFAEGHAREERQVLPGTRDLKVMMRPLPVLVGSVSVPEGQRRPIEVHLTFPPKPGQPDWMRWSRWIEVQRDGTFRVELGDVSSVHRLDTVRVRAEGFAPHELELAAQAARLREPGTVTRVRVHLERE